MDKGFDNPTLNLMLMMEECGELTQVCSKVYRWGINDAHPKTGKTNKEALVEEMGDVYALLAIIANTYDIPDEEIDTRISAKFKKLNKWYDRGVCHG